MQMWMNASCWVCAAMNAPTQYLDTSAIAAVVTNFATIAVIAKRKDPR